MKKIADILFSTQLMAVLLIIFGFSIGLATFIENDFGTSSARAMFYNATWFEVLMFVGMINLVGVIIRYKMYRKGKLTIFIFHISFLVILVGAAITRYIGYEGSMRIREGQTTNQVISEQAYVTMLLKAGDETRFYQEKVLFSYLGGTDVRHAFDLNGEEVHVKKIEFVPNASQTVVEDPMGEPIVELVSAGGMGRNSIVLTEGGSAQTGNMPIIFSRDAPDGVFQIYLEDGMLYFKSPIPVQSMSMMDQSVTEYVADSIHPFEMRKLYSIGQNRLVLKNYFLKGIVQPTYTPDTKDNEMIDAVVFEVKKGNEQKKLIVYGEKGMVGNPVSTTINGTEVSLTYGSKIIDLPFSLKLNDFILERYPGSNSPSWYESDVTLIDKSVNLEEDRRIYMNNILNYRGYRFYQSSYDTDEKGTILSVNHDLWGTLITYFGYFLLSVGMIASLINRKSRFRWLFKDNKKIREIRKGMAMVAIIALASFGGLYAQDEDTIQIKNVVDETHAREFGELLIQDIGGRIKPINTLSSEILRKVARMDEFRGLTSEQVMLGMMINPRFWQNIPLIRISHPQMQELLNTGQKLVSFNQMVNPMAQKPYILSDYASQAHQKKPAWRSKFDNEVIKVDERVNIAYLVFTGNLLRIFPQPEDENNKWYAPNNAAEHFSGEDSLFVVNIIPLYFSSLNNAISTGDYTEANEYLDAIKMYQGKFGEEVMPPDSRIQLEIFYNRADIFERLASFYGLLGFILLIMNFITIFKPAITLRKPLLVGWVLTLIAFAFHTGGLAIRWYVSGHAPWSNGYESMIYISWATILAGIIFAKRAQITLPATTLLAWLILYVAHLSWMDPEITTLVPVLKSYWLIIHVAIITASYGFLALGAILAFLNLVLYFFKSTKNNERINLTIHEISHTIEMTLVIGLYMLTIGTFLGGVWANESWGRYWGWDPKETWALVSIIVYAFILHMRLVPGLRGDYAFNFMSLIGFSSIIMTYFGVNYYLSGLHSYAAGDPLPIPTFVYYTISIIAVVALLAYLNHKSVEKKVNKLNEQE